jgi:hypothetical protein
MVNLISQAEYARQKKLSREAVSKAVRTGRITLIDGKIDPEVADIQWKRNTDPDQAMRTKGGQASQSRGQNTLDGAHSGEGPEDDGEGFSTATLLGYKERIARSDAERKEDELRKSRQELVAVAAVQRESFGKARMARDLLLNMPVRLAPTLVGKTSKEIATAMREELRKIIEVISAPGEGSEH